MTVVTEYLETKAIPFEVLPHGAAFTAADEARSLGIDPHVVAKTLLVDTRWGRALAVVPGDRRADMDLVRDAVGDHAARLAGETEIIGAFPDHQLGALAPLGAMLDLPTYVDGDLLRHEYVVFAAGSRSVAVRVRSQDLFDHEHVTASRLTIDPTDRYI
jgi:prolyl-tRNA editing enzyme YbaK/EbsC (Cys-tRNA(Pro) deacylase)